MIANSEERSAPETSAATVTVVIPCRAEYVAVARLAILGVANRLDYSYDEVEDVRLAVGEACTHAVARANAGGVDSSEAGEDQRIWIDSSITSEGLSIEVRDTIPAVAMAAEEMEFDIDDDDAGISIDKQDLGALLMEILVDSVSVEAGPAGTVVRLYKKAPQHHNHA